MSVTNPEARYLPPQLEIPADRLEVSEIPSDAIPIPYDYDRLEEVLGMLNKDELEPVPGADGAYRGEILGEDGEVSQVSLAGEALGHDERKGLLTPGVQLSETLLGSNITHITHLIPMKPGHFRLEVKDVNGNAYPHDADVPTAKNLKHYYLVETTSGLVCIPQHNN